MKILVIGAHPDDIEIFMYGLVALLKKRGDEIRLAIATDGAAGTVTNSKNLAFMRMQETEKALKPLGKPDFLKIPDGRLSHFSASESIIYDYIKEVSPDLIKTHSPEDYHPDHRALSMFVSQSVGFTCPILYADTLMGVQFLPEFYIDITDVFKEKMNAISKHISQTPEKFISATTLLNRFRSSQCNGPEGTYAEAYKMSRTFPFSDIRSLLPEAPRYRPYYTKNSDGLI